jgi:hypothetical protein
MTSFHVLHLNPLSPHDLITKSSKINSEPDHTFNVITSHSTTNGNIWCPPLRAFAVKHQGKVSFPESWMHVSPKENKL